MKWGNYFPSAAMIVVSILEFADKDTSSGMTWLVRACILCVKRNTGQKEARQK